MEIYKDIGGVDQVDGMRSRWEERELKEGIGMRAYTNTLILYTIFDEEWKWIISS